MMRRLVTALVVTSFMLPVHVRAQEVSMADLGFCTDQVAQISKMTGYYKTLCQRLIDSPEFRQSCSEVEAKDRLKCDGHEPQTSSEIRPQDFSKCLPNAFQGIKDGWTETAYYGWMAIKSIASYGVHLYSSGTYEVADQSTQAEPANEPSDEAIDGFRSAAKQAKAGVPATSDGSAYAVNSAEDDGEKPSMFELMKSWEFWKIFGEELVSWAKEQNSQLDCLNPAASADMVCYVLGAMSPTGFGKLIRIVGKAGKLGTKAAKALLSKEGVAGLKKFEKAAMKVNAAKDVK